MYHQSTCSLCGHKIAPPQGPDDDYEVLLRRADHWNNVAQQAIDQRARWLRKANALRSATSPLPNEILVTIFKFACPPIDVHKRVFCRDLDDIDDDDDDYADDNDDDGWPVPSREKEDLGYRRFPMVLGAVSSRWREVVWSAPDLWNTLAIEPTYKTVGKEAARLQFYLTNAKSLGFVLDIDLRRFNEETEFINEHSSLLGDVIADPRELSLKPLKAVIFGDMAKNIQTLRIAGAPGSWLPDVNRKVSNVVDLSLASRYDHYPRLESLAIRELKSLHHVHLINISPSETSTLPSNITTIRLKKVGLDNCIGPLLQCTSLVEFHVCDPLSPSTPNPAPALLQAPLVRSTVKRLSWDNSRSASSWNDAFLQMVRFPNLEYLEWTDGPSRGTLKPEVDFFSNLPSSLTSLTLLNDFTTSLGYEKRPRLRRMFMHLSQIKELTLLECYNEYAQDIFVLLSRGSDDNYPSSPNDFVFPNLTRIIYHPPECMSSRYVDSDEGDNRWNESDDCYDSEESTATDDLDVGRVVLYPRYFMEVMRWRSRIMKIPYFRLELTKCRLERVKAVWKKFREIVDGGLMLEIVEDTRLIDWSGSI